MRRLALLLSCLALAFSGSTFGQNYVDVIRYSRPDDLGSARYMGMAGAFSALGNDFGAVSINPAGIAVYRHSEVGMTLYNRSTRTSSEYFMQSSDQGDNQFRFSQVGLVSHADISDNSHFNFGLRYHRSNDYGFDQRVTAQNLNTSILDQWEILANAFAPNGEDLAGVGLLYEDMASDVGLIEYQNNQWVKGAGTSSLTQDQTYSSRGGKGIFGIDFGYQTDNRWNVGGSIEIPTLSYETTETYTERDYDAGSNYSRMEWVNRYQLTGVGVQIKLGVIFTPEDYGRFAAYIHTPTWWSMTQEGDSQMRSVSNSGGSQSSYQPFNQFQWELQTPMRVGAGYAYVFDKKGLLSIDYSYQAMQYAEASSTEFPGSVDYINDDLEDEAQGWHDIRIGGEMRVDKWFFRGGVHFTTTPFKNSEEVARQYAGGFGFKENLWGADISYSLRTRENSFYLYAPELTEAVNRTSFGHFITATVYFRI
ncbi:MAG: hypothetical protein HWE14_10520 [Flavobacteriia bacterium]|nr:hypothetical protein [Flavobacteriia bacterium]